MHRYFPQHCRQISSSFYSFRVKDPYKTSKVIQNARKIWDQWYNVENLKQTIQAEIAFVSSTVLKSIRNSMNFRLKSASIFMENIPKGVTPDFKDSLYFCTFWS
jgi:hypothetical protein